MQDVFEMQKDAIQPGQNVVIIDDLVATGTPVPSYCTRVIVLRLLDQAALLKLQGSLWLSWAGRRSSTSSS